MRLLLVPVFGRRDLFLPDPLPPFGVPEFFSLVATFRPFDDHQDRVAMMPLRWHRRQGHLRSSAPLASCVPPHELHVVIPPPGIAALWGGDLIIPIMCQRSIGIPYQPHRYATSLAEERYIGVVNHAGSSRYPSCSMPMECRCACQEPACHAMFVSSTHWAIWPSHDLTT